MKSIEIQNRIVNLDNVTIVSNYAPGDPIPGSQAFATHFRRAVICFDFIGQKGNSIFKNTGGRFVYEDENECASDWERLLDAFDACVESACPEHDNF